MKKKQQATQPPVKADPPSTQALRDEQLQQIVGGGGSGPIQPRPGEDVIVSFVIGSPNSPLLSGKLWNG